MQNLCSQRRSHHQIDTKVQKKVSQLKITTFSRVNNYDYTHCRVQYSHLSKRPTIYYLNTVFQLFFRAMGIISHNLHAAV